MGKEDEYRRNAEQAERLMELARTEAERVGYRKVAEGWRQLLVTQERRLQRR